MTTLQDYTADGEILSVPDKTLIFSPGDESHAFLIVTQGAVRVEQTNSSGRTIVLYRVVSGDSCVLTTTCRALKVFEDKGWVKIGRGSVTVTDRAALESHGM